MGLGCGVMVAHSRFQLLSCYTSAYLDNFAEFTILAREPYVFVDAFQVKVTEKFCYRIASVRDEKIQWTLGNVGSWY